ncbi:MAG: PAS domain S-box protein, partial [Hymenobacter sp.]
MQGTVEEISIELVRSDRTRIPVLLNAILEKKPEDGQATVYYTFFDISQRKKYEQELLLAAQKQKELLLQVQQRNLQIQKDNAYYKSIIDNQSFYIIKTDLEGNYTYLNPSYCKVMGIAQQDWIGKSPFTLVMPEDHSLCLETMQSCFADPDKTHWAIIRMLSPKGILITQWEFSLLWEDTLNAEAFLGIGHDITPLIKKQEDLQSLVDVTALQNKRLNNFTYIISHNIRSHVANLSGILDITDMNDPEDRNFSFSILRKSVGALDETIHHLNDIISIQDNTNLPKSVLHIKNEVNKILE